MKTFLKVVGIISVAEGMFVLGMYFLGSFVFSYFFHVTWPLNTAIDVAWLWFTFGFATLAIGSVILLVLTYCGTKKK